MLYKEFSVLKKLAFKRRQCLLQRNRTASVIIGLCSSMKTKNNDRTSPLNLRAWRPQCRIIGGVEWPIIGETTSEKTSGDVPSYH